MIGENKKKPFIGLVGLAIILVLLVSGSIALLLLIQIQPGFFHSKKADSSTPLNEAVEDSQIVDGIHVETGFVVGEGLTVVINNCTNCHSAKLVTQNRATAEGWTQIIRWMQETQNLWDLGENEAIIVSYLSTHYPPETKGRRKPLEVEWYELE